MKKLKHVILGVAVACAVTFSFTQCGDAKDAVVTKLLEVQAQAVNAQCPIQLNSAMRMDSCQVLPQKTLKFFYTIALVDAADFNAADFERMTKPGLVYNIQTNEELKQAREYEVVFMYVYMDDKGKTLGEISVTAEDYNKPVDESNKGDIASASEEDVENTLKSVVAGMKSRLPMAVADGVDLVECQALGKVLEYTYQIKNQSVAKFDSTAFKTTTKNASVQMLGSNPQVMAMMEKGIVYSYIYKDKNGKYLCRIDINSGDF